jgi:hypothetical protein
MNYYIAVLVGCFALLTTNVSHGTALVMEYETNDPNFIFKSHSAEFNSYNKAGDGLDGQPEAILKGGLHGSPQLQQVTQQGQYAWGNNVPQPVVLRYSALTHLLHLSVGTGSEQMNLTVPVREGFYFNGLAIGVFINRGLSPQGSIRLKIDEVNGVTFDKLLAASYPRITGEDESTGIYWDVDHLLPQQDVTAKFTATFINGSSYHNSFSISPALVSAVPEPAALGLLLAGATFLGSLRLRKL